MNEVDIEASTKIYKTLINGRVINRYSLSDDGVERENRLFTEISNNFNDFKRQYQMSGLELIARNDFYYVREANPEAPYTDPVKRIQALLLVIGRHVTKTGSMYEKLAHPLGGIADEDIAAIAAEPEYVEILNAVDVKDLATAVKTHLLERGIMEEPRPGRYVLSAAGKHFFNELFGAAER